MSVSMKSELSSMSREPSSMAYSGSQPWDVCVCVCVCGGGGGGGGGGGDLKSGEG